MLSGLRRTSVIAVCLVAAGALAVPAQAATPGRNGWIVHMNDGAIVSADTDPGTDDEIEIVPAASFPDDPRWSPDGTRIAYIAWDVNDELQLFVVDADEGGQRQVTQLACDGTDVASIGEVDWSPDAQWLVFSEYRCDGDSERITKIRLDGTGKKPLTSFQTDRYDYQPRWSPDGRLIAFVSGSTGDTLTLVNQDGTNRRVWRTKAYDPAWSPEGKRLAFRFVDGPDRRTGIRALSGGIVRIVDTGDFTEWSPDGIRLVYSVDTGPGGYEAWIRRADGTGSATKIGPATPSSGVPLPHWQPTCDRKGNGNPNTLTGTAKSELLCGFGGDDTIDGKGGLDIIFAGTGNDKVKGGPGNDVLVGEKGNDRLDGGKGTDRCVQGPGTGALISC